jgi:hypothetical protein
MYFNIRWVILVSLNIIFGFQVVLVAILFWQTSGLVYRLLGPTSTSDDSIEANCYSTADDAALEPVVEHLPVASYADSSFY